MLVTDHALEQLPPVAIALESLRKAGVEAEVFSNVRVEPNDASWAEAIAFAQAGNFDGYVSVGGGSVMDTAKVADLCDLPGRSSGLCLYSTRAWYSGARSAEAAYRDSDHRRDEGGNDRERRFRSHHPPCENGLPSIPATDGRPGRSGQHAQHAAALVAAMVGSM